MSETSVASRRMKPVTKRKKAVRITPLTRSTVLPYLMRAHAQQSLNDIPPDLPQAQGCLEICEVVR